MFAEVLDPGDLASRTPLDTRHDPDLCVGSDRYDLVYSSLTAVNVASASRRASWNRSS